MSTPRSRNIPDWRLFEQLVARLEQAAAPRHAVVKSPDRIRDLQTGQLREVDASIVFRAGSEDILITVECRKRTKKADDTWIEQLATKRLKIGATKTVAVSSSGFSKPAASTAAANAIELRTFKAVRESDIDDWFLPPQSIHVTRMIEDIECRVETLNSVHFLDPMQPSLHHPIVHGAFPPALLIKFTEVSDGARFWRVPLDGRRSKMSFSFGAQGTERIPVPGSAPGVQDEIEAEIDGTRYPVERLDLTCTVWYESISVDRDAMAHGEYANSSGLMTRHSSLEKDSGGLPVRFDHYQGDDGSHTSTVTYPSGVVVESAHIPLSRRVNQVTHLDVRSLHMRVVGVKLRTSEQLLRGFLFTFPRQELMVNPVLSRLLRDNFLFAQHADIGRMTRFLAALERKIYLKGEAGEVLQLLKEDVEYVDLLPDHDDG